MCDIKSSSLVRKTAGPNWSMVQWPRTDLRLPYHHEDSGTEWVRYKLHWQTWLSHSLSAKLSSWTQAVPKFAIPSEEWPYANVTDEPSLRIHATDWERSDECVNVKWLSDRLNSSSASIPFMLSCGFSCPHPPYMTSKYWFENGVSQDAIKMPVWIDEDKMHPVQRYETITKNCSDF